MYSFTLTLSKVFKYIDNRLDWEGCVNQRHAWGAIGKQSLCSDIGHFVEDRSRREESIREDRLLGVYSDNL